MTLPEMEALRESLLAETPLDELDGKCRDLQVKILDGLIHNQKIINDFPLHEEGTSKGEWVVTVMIIIAVAVYFYLKNS